MGERREPRNFERLCFEIDRLRYGTDQEVGHDDRDAKISSYLLRVARIKGELKIEMYVTIVVEDDARHQASPSAETVPSTQ